MLEFLAADAFGFTKATKGLAVHSSGMEGLVIHRDGKGRAIIEFKGDQWTGVLWCAEDRAGKCCGVHSASVDYPR